jgi:hypothetical protein
MLSKDTIKKISTLLKIKEADVEAAIKNEAEVSLEIPELKVYTTEEYTQLESNLKDAGKNGYIKAGKEIVIKDLKEKIGLEFEGKDPEVFIEKAKEHFIAEAKVPANAAKEQWERDKQTLTTQITEWKSKYESEMSAKKAAEFDSTLLRNFPADRSKTLSDDDRLLLVKAKVEVKDEDGKQVVYYKGQPLKDTLTNPLGIDAALKEVFTKENWIGEQQQQQTGGRGGGSTSGFKPLKMSEAAKDWQDKHPDKGLGAEFQAYVAQIRKENPEFVVDSITA